MSNEDAAFIKELSAWLADESRKRRLLDTKIVKEGTLDQILNGRYNPSDKLRTNLRAQMVVIDSSHGQKAVAG